MANQCEFLIKHMMIVNKLMCQEKIMGKIQSSEKAFSQAFLI